MNRVRRSRLAGSLVAKLGDESSATRHEWVRRDEHAAKPTGSREVTQVSTAAREYNLHTDKGPLRFATEGADMAAPTSG